MKLIKLAMPTFDITEKRPCINIFKLNKAYYFKHFFDDPAPFTVEISRYQKYGELLKKKLSGTLKMKRGRHPNMDYLD